MNAPSRLRVGRLRAVFAAGLALLLGRLVQLQVLEHRQWERESTKIRIGTESVPYRRGEIVDRNGEVLALDRESFDLALRYRLFRRGHPVGLAAHLLSLVLGRAVSVEEVAGDPADAAAVILALTPARLAAVPKGERGDVSFYLGRLLRPEWSERRVARLLASAERSGGDEPIALRLGADAASVEARIRGSLADLERLERACAIPAGTLLEEAEARRRAIDAAVGRVESRDASTPAQVKEREVDLGMRARIVARDVPFDGAWTLALGRERFAGWEILETTRRTVAADAPVTVIGLLRKWTEDELARIRDDEGEVLALRRLLDRTPAQQARLEEIDARLREGRADGVGAFGVEALLDESLRGRRGRRLVLRDTEVAEEASDLGIAPVHGRRVALTLDVGIQRAAEAVLREGWEEWRDVVGAIAVLDCRTGEVLALASNPTVREEEYRQRYADLAADPLHPLLPRAFRPYFPPAPGSVFKLVVATAALEEGVVTEGEPLECAGLYENLRCLGIHGAIDLGEALEHSCNVYFYRLGERLGYARLADWARRFGFAGPTGIEIEEVEGSLRSGGFPAAARHLAIGQAYLTVTPLQIARMVAAFGNGGRLPVLRIVREAGGLAVRGSVAEDLGISPATLAAVRGAMRRVVRTGTAEPRLGMNLDRWEVDGKTGTAEVGKNVETHAWFAGIAPRSNPRIAFAIYCERVGLHGGELAAPLAEPLLASAAVRAYLAGAVEAGK